MIKMQNPLNQLLKSLVVFACVAALSVACSPQSEKPAEKPAEKTAEKPAEKPAEKTAEKPAKRVYFTNLKEGASVKSPFTVKFGVEGMTIRPALEDINDKTSGHHHLIIDGEGIPAGQGVPMDATHIHYGKGQTEAEITLKPGAHTLRLQFADGAHRSYGPEMSAAIKVTVTE